MQVVNIAPMVVINGTLCDPSLWDAFFQESGGRLVPSFPDVTAGKSVEAYAREIGGSLPSSGAWVLGYSLGGIIALELARQFQHSMAGLVLVCTNPRGQSEEKNAALDGEQGLLEERGLDAVFEEMFLPAYFGPDYADYTEADRVKRMGLQLGPWVLRNQRDTLRTRIDQTPFLRYITVPTLLVCGENDRLCTVEDNRVMAREIPHCALRVIEGAGHMLPVLRPHLLWEEISAFMER